MKDFFGQTLVIGDKVAMTEPYRNSAYLVEGTIISFSSTGSSCVVRWTRFPPSTRDTRREGNQLVKKL